MIKRLMTCNQAGETMLFVGTIFMMGVVLTPLV